MWGRSPPPKKGGGGKAPSLGCVCAYIGGCGGISAPFILPTQNLRFPRRGGGLLVGWKGFAQVFIDDHTKSKLF